MLIPGGPDGLVVLGGSSGRVEEARARMFAAHGLTTLAIRWFGGPGQPSGPCEVPLETFTAAVDVLEAHGVRRIGMLGTSKGAEAAMVTAVRDPRVDVVVALAPTAYVWEWTGRSSWTWRGRALDAVPMDAAWLAERRDAPKPTAIRDWCEASERRYAGRLAGAAIPVEDMRADLVLVAGRDDRMWPADRYAALLGARRRAAGRSVRVIERGDAGHRLVFPGEVPLPASVEFDYGGTDAGDALLGAEALPVVLAALRGE